MMHEDTQKNGFSLKKMDTEQLDKLMSRIVQEMRRRESEHVKADVVSNSQSLRKLRSTNQLPQARR